MIAWLGLLRSLALYYGRPWRIARLRRFYAGLAREAGPVPPVAIDVGAHVGHRARALKGAGFRVIAVEPQPLFRDFLRRTMPGGVVVEPCAIAGAAGEADLAVSPLHATVSSLSGGWLASVAGTAGFRHVRWSRRERVPVETLDALIARHGPVGLIKLDIEGGEPEALAGLSHPVPLLSLEYNGAALGRAIACLDRLSALGPYRFNRIPGERLVFAEAEWLDRDAMADSLRARVPEGHSGDLYARLTPPPALAESPVDAPVDAPLHAPLKATSSATGAVPASTHRP